MDTSHTVQGIGGEPAKTSNSAGLRKIHPLVATAAVAVTAVCVIAAVQFLSPQNARSAADRDAGYSSASPGAVPGAAMAPVGPGVAPSAAPPPSAAAVCAECGQIVNIRTTHQQGSGSGVGAVAGGLLGGVLGHQLGAGRGKEAMTVVGAVGGAVAGNEVEKQAKSQTLYHVDVRMADGSARTVTLSSAPNLPVGAQVRVIGNTIAAR